MSATEIEKTTDQQLVAILQQWLPVQPSAPADDITAVAEEVIVSYLKRMTDKNAVSSMADESFDEYVRRIRILQGLIDGRA